MAIRKAACLIIEAADDAEAKALFAADPYAQAGLVRAVQRKRFKTVFRDGVLQQ